MDQKTKIKHSATFIADEVISPQGTIAALTWKILQISSSKSKPENELASKPLKYIPIADVYFEQLVSCVFTVIQFVLKKGL